MRPDSRTDRSDDAPALFRPHWPLAWGRRHSRLCSDEHARSDESPIGASTATGGLPGLPHFPPKARRAIYLHMNGGPSQMDLFDYKPKMGPMFDKDLPDSIRRASV